MTEYGDAGVTETELRDAVDELHALRDELYIAGFPVPMPVEPDREDHIQRILAAHRAAERTPAAAARGRSRRRFFTLAGGVVAAATAGTAGWLAFDQSRPRSAYAATPRALVVRPDTGDARRRLEQIAAQAPAIPAVAGPVEHLLTVGWDLNSQVDGHTVTSAVIPSRHELWRAAGNTAVTIEQNEPPQFPSDQDRDAWQDDGSPGADRSPVRTPYPDGSFAAAWNDRPPADPAKLAPWLRRQDPTDAAIPSAIPELLRERVLTGPEHRALLAVLATEPGLRLLGTTTDRAGRAGLVFAIESSASGGDISHRFVISPDTGQVLADEKILTGGAPALHVRRPAVISYVTYLKAEYVTAIG